MITTIRGRSAKGRLAKRRPDIAILGQQLVLPVVFYGNRHDRRYIHRCKSRFHARELAYQLKNSEARFLVYGDSSLEVGIESIGMGKDHIFRFDETLFKGNGTSRLGVRNCASLMEIEAVGRRFQWDEPVVCLNYSSDITGVPKVVMITHYAYVADCA